jgi:DNA-binding NtrC family response regulator
VRELENVIERAVILTAGTSVRERDLPPRIRRGRQAATPLPAFDVSEPLPEVVRRIQTAVEREYLKRVLRRYRGHVGKVSEHAGLSRRALYNKLQRHGLKREDYR